MKAKLLTITALVAGMATGVYATLSSRVGHSVADTRVTGDYVEARTASVFAGACHYNGELVTTGRDAVLAWDFTGGSYQGVDLRGVKAMAAVDSPDNLGDGQGARQTELAVDSSASAAQASAVAALLEARCGSQLGPIVAVRRTKVTFAHGETGYTVEAPGFGAMAVEYRADNACCIQPNLVWYTPLMPLESRKVGYTDEAAYQGKLGMPWERSGEDSAFYGTFSL